MAPKLRAVQIHTNPNEEREQRSYVDITRLEVLGLPTHHMHSPLYSGALPPAREANDRPFKLTQRHYGCYKAHKNAFKEMKDGADGLVIFECDAVFSVSPEEMYQRIQRAYQACIEGNLAVFTFGPKHDGRIIDTVGDDVITISQFIETHAYLIPSTSYGYFEYVFSRPWDALDYVYTIYMYDRDNQRIGTFRDRPVCVQADGMSIVDGRIKKSEQHWKDVRYEN